MFVTLGAVAQDSDDLDTVRKQFQVIDSKEDIQKIMLFQIDDLNSSVGQIITAYKAAATCMMANYVFSPKSKLKYFNQGKKDLEELIRIDKEVENVYLRLLLQLNVPKMLNYNDNIDDDVAYLDEFLGVSDIDVDYKNTMIQNLLSVAKKKELKEALLQIEVVNEK